MRKILGAISIMISVIAASPHSHAVDFQDDENLYVLGTVANVRVEPRENARISARLPIGTRVTYVGITTNLPPEYGECPGRKADNAKWVCVRLPDLDIDYGVYWSGWISADLLGRKMPKVDELIARFDEVPKLNLLERRKWAERAAVLEPWNPDVHKRLIDVLNEIGDQDAYSSAKKTFSSYQNPESNIGQSASKHIFTFIDGFLQPILELKAGKVVTRNFDHDFTKRGRFYQLYSQGKHVGSVVTQLEFDCTVKTCPGLTLARVVPTPAPTTVHSALALNFSLPQEGRTTPVINEKQEATLVNMALAWINAARWSSPKAKKRFLEGVQKGTCIAHWLPVDFQPTIKWFSLEIGLWDR